VGGTGVGARVSTLTRGGGGGGITNTGPGCAGRDSRGLSTGDSTTTGLNPVAGRVAAGAAGDGVGGAEA
jgi:hypothetical protein